MNESNWREKVMELVGTATMCWNPRPSGVFDSVEASKIGTQIQEVFIAELITLISQLEGERVKIEIPWGVGFNDGISVAQDKIKEYLV